MRKSQKNVRKTSDLIENDHGKELRKGKMQDDSGAN